MPEVATQAHETDLGYVQWQPSAAAIGIVESVGGNDQMVFLCVRPEPTLESDARFEVTLDLEAGIGWFHPDDVPPWVSVDQRGKFRITETPLLAVDRDCNCGH